MSNLSCDLVVATIMSFHNTSRNVVRVWPCAGKEVKAKNKSKMMHHKAFGLRNLFVQLSQRSLRVKKRESEKEEVKKDHEFWIPLELSYMEHYGSLGFLSYLRWKCSGIDILLEGNLVP